MAKSITLNGYPFTLVRGGTQKAHDLYKRWERALDVDLYDAYGRPSGAKMRAFEYCREMEYKFHSFTGRITGHNMMQFSYAFTCRIEGNEYLVYITKDNNYLVELFI